MRLPIRIKVQALRRDQSLAVLIGSPSSNGYMNFIMFNRLTAMAVFGVLLWTTLRSLNPNQPLWNLLPTNLRTILRTFCCFLLLCPLDSQSAFLLCLPSPCLLCRILTSSADFDFDVFRGFHRRVRTP